MNSILNQEASAGGRNGSDAGGDDGKGAPFAKAAMLAMYAEYVSHEINAPLSWIKGNLELLRECESGSTTAASYFEGAMAGVCMIEDAVRDYLSLYRPVSSDARALVDPVPLAEDVFWKIAFFRQSKAFRLCLSRLPLLRVPRALLARVFFNFIYNAFVCEHAASDVEIEIGTEETSEGGAIFVRSGRFRFPEEFNRVVFDSSPEGSGLQTEGAADLGLHLVSSGVEVHGLKIWAKTMCGRGSAFYLVFDPSLLTLRNFDGPVG